MNKQNRVPPEWVEILNVSQVQMMTIFESHGHVIKKGRMSDIYNPDKVNYFSEMQEIKLPTIFNELIQKRNKVSLRLKQYIFDSNKRKGAKR